MQRLFESISYHAVYDRSITEALEYAGENGFAGIQVADETPHLSLERLSAGQVDTIRSKAGELGLYLVLHAADESASLFQADRRLMSGIREYYTALLESARRISARLVTVHAGEPARFHTDSLPEQEFPEEDLTVYQDVFRDNLEFLLDLNKDPAIPVCIENYKLNRTILDILVPYLDRGNLFLCWDIAKSYGKPELESFFFEHLSWVKQVHLHDWRRNPDGTTRSHCVIGTGEIDFTQYLSRLAEEDVLDYCIEVRPREKARESLEALKRVYREN
ncbi:MAG: sugar phosphate isomerase/epimerase [Dehalococcoidales bacterium]|nr:sugar phosphate isomerase/epimerase [Dehalococcoidales bacterium]